MFEANSVPYSSQWESREPTARGGHLVLVLQASLDEVVFHNPSGDTRTSQECASLPCSTFSKYFAGRGIAIRKAPN